MEAKKSKPLDPSSSKASMAKMDASFKHKPGDPNEGVKSLAKQKGME